MQTFLPYPSFEQSAKVLDMRRLGKQRVEAKQIYLALTNPTYGWQNHPAVRMWRGHELALAEYGYIICEEWLIRGYNDTLQGWFGDRCHVNITDNPRPTWLGNESFHLSHQSNLLRKLPEHYSKYFIGVPNDLPYVWPV